MLRKRIGVWPQSRLGELWIGVPTGPRGLCRCSSHRHKPPNPPCDIGSGFLFFEITVLGFSPILQTALLASAVMVRCRGSCPISAPNAVVGKDFKAPVIPLRIRPLSFSNLDMAVFCLTLLHRLLTHKLAWVAESLCRSTVVCRVSGPNYFQ